MYMQQWQWLAQSLKIAAPVHISAAFLNPLFYLTFFLRSELFKLFQSLFKMN